MLESLKKTLSIIVSILLLTFIAANIIRLAFFVLEANNII
jgi:hypothetical protein